MASARWSAAATEPGRRAAVVQASLGFQRFVTLLLFLFAPVVLVLAVVGLYGVVSYSVSRRVHEMGIRIALGAADPATFATAAVLLIAVATVVSAIPAQRAVKVDPMAVLKNE